MKKISVILLIAFSIFNVSCSGLRIALLDTKFPLEEYTLEGSGTKKVLLLPVNGVISDEPKKGLVRTLPSGVQQVVAQLNKAEKDKDIKVVLIKINSPGGTITASDILYNELMSFKQRTGTKIAVMMMDVAASGAYYIALPADMIMAHPTTITGSVGVLYLKPELFGLMDKFGIGVDVIKFGKHKDMGSPFRVYTEEEQVLIHNLTDELGERFLTLVQKHRHLKENDLEEVKKARVFLSREALKLGLLDKVGYLPDAIVEAKKLAELTADSKVIVYRRSDYPEDNMYNIAGVSTEDASRPAINIELPESLSLKAGFYYLWPGAL
jgi:protease-4